ncbi:NAC domain-containing protein 67-like [Salvia splendens]|uniref:NAC domain-containing protein 67-like n=1 Tax=Salvia splendens TaxID=180675 RepID=UPI001C26654F|nr:NAC domain-containing protein 67-like [Salvia splendens]
MYRASGDRVWYYFTQRRRKHRRGNVVDRTAAGGYWDRVTAPKDIMHNRRVIGSCRLFAYFTGKRRDSVRTDWMMQEFTAPENRARMKALVVCKMYKNETRRSRKRNHDGEANNNPGLG